MEHDGDVMAELVADHREVGELFARFDQAPRAARTANGLWTLWRSSWCGTPLPSVLELTGTEGVFRVFPNLADALVEPWLISLQPPRSRL
ncbi:hypothetical protein San01_17390 [Streptomyces angustmyceticus]|uniref:Uncharacterized protein n=1 Tax=Streptomyces angustmyceticus TaxID=285578 RepID=A0A5J4LAI8_9ACTN|nr:hypothetical protein San01_17390 [Streptomyces angustmyceticus]